MRRYAMPITIVLAALLVAGTPEPAASLSTGATPGLITPVTLNPNATYGSFAAAPQVYHPGSCYDRYWYDPYRYWDYCHPWGGVVAYSPWYWGPGWGWGWGFSFGYASGWHGGGWSVSVGWGGGWGHPAPYYGYWGPGSWGWSSSCCWGPSWGWGPAWGTTVVYTVVKI